VAYVLDHPEYYLSVHTLHVVCLCVEEIDVVGSSQDASTDSDVDADDDALGSADKAFTVSLRLSHPL